MFLFKSKTISARQTLVVGFVLALLSMLSMALITYLLPMAGAWLNGQGVTELDLFYTVFIFIFLCSVQGLILFGFPLYYAQDQKSHMTGFRILLSALGWMVLMMVVTGLVFVKIHQVPPAPAVDSYAQPSVTETVPEPEVVPEVPVQE